MKNTILTSIKQPKILLLIGIVILAILVRLPMLGWYIGDSGFVSIYSRSVYERSLVIRYRYSGYAMAQKENYAPLYYFIVALFYHLFGVTYLHGCAVTFIFGVLTVPATYWLANNIYGQREGLISALVISILPWHIVYSGIVLIDPVATFFITISVITFLRALKTEKWSDYIIFGFVMGLSFLTKIYSFMLFPIFFLYLILHYFSLRERGKIIASSFRVNLVWFLLGSILSFMMLFPWLLNVGILKLATHEAIVTLLDPSIKISPLYSINFLAIELKFMLIVLFLGIIKVFYNKDGKGLLLFMLIFVPFAGYTVLAYNLRILHAFWNFPRYNLMTIPPMCILISKGIDFIHDLSFNMYRYFPNSLQPLLQKLKRYRILMLGKNKLSLFGYTALIFCCLFLVTRYYRLLIIGQVYFNGTEHIGDRQEVIEMTCKYIEIHLPQGSIIVADNSDIFWLAEFYLNPEMEIRSKDDIGRIIRSSINKFYLISYFESPQVSHSLKVKLLYTAYNVDHPNMNGYLFELSV